MFFSSFFSFVPVFFFLSKMFGLNRPKVHRIFFGLVEYRLIGLTRINPLAQVELASVDRDLPLRMCEGQTVDAAWRCSAMLL